MFNLVQGRRNYFIFSGILIALGIAAMVYSLITTGAVFPLGVDFRGGTRFELQFTQPVIESQIEDVFASFDITNISATVLQGESLENAWQIRSPYVSAEKGQAILTALGQDVVPLISDATSVQSISPSVGNEVTRAAFIAILVAAAATLIYIVVAFRQVPNSFRYGTSAVVAMIHDLFIIFGFAAIMGMLRGWEVDALFLTATLTIAGFSLQDTIIVFDRIRENIAKRPFEKFEIVVNRSVLETIHRSLTIQLNAMFIMVAILLFGGASIKPFIAVLFVGMLSGTYSSIFTAVPLLVAWEEKELPFVK